MMRHPLKFLALFLFWVFIDCITNMNQCSFNCLSPLRSDNYVDVSLRFSYQFPLLLVLVLSNAIESNGQERGGHCTNKLTLNPRPHTVSILEFGAVGDGKTLNTIAFQNAIFYLKSFADKGGAQLYVPPGKWLTASFNLTSHLTLFLERGAVILGSQVYRSIRS